MKHLIDKSVLIAEIEKMKNKAYPNSDWNHGHVASCEKILSLLDTLEVKDPYEQSVQYDSITAGIQAHAETYSFNIESELFNQLTKEQQKLWRKEIEQAVISGGQSGVELARDTRYKENLEVKKGLLGYIKSLQEEPVSEHWQEVRERAAIAAMQGLLANSSKVGKIVDYTMSAVDYADALIEQLKKKSQ